MRNEVFGVLLGAAVLLGVIGSVYADEPEPVLNAISSVMESNLVIERVCSEASKEKDNVMIERLLQNEEDIQHYAYMDIKAANESLYAVILAAREKVIFRQGWVVDGINGHVVDESGNIIEEVPHFSEIFPSDWDVPTVSTEIDLSYYGK